MTRAAPFARLTGDARVLLVLDIDGTLVRQGYTSTPSAVSALHDLDSLGVTIVLATGRQLHGVEPVVAALGLDDVWVVASDGAIEARYVKGTRTALRTHTFDPRPIAQALARRDPDVTIGLEDVGVGYMVNRRFEKLIDRDDVQQIVGEFAPTATMLTAGSALLTGGQMAQSARELGLSCTGWDEFDMGWVDVAAPGLSKATGATALVDSDLVACDFSVAVGDFLNDIDLLRWANVGVAMGHAPGVVKEAADLVVGSIDDDGVTDVLASLVQQVTENQSRRAREAS